MTGGLVKSYNFAILSNVTPIHCVILVFVTQLPVLCKLCFTKNPENPNLFLKSLILSSLCSFYFGWHVHEKASLTFTLPLTILLLRDYRILETYQILTISSTFAILPLLHTKELFLLKLLLFTLYVIFILYIVPPYLKMVPPNNQLLKNYYCGFFLILFFEIIHGFFFVKFLPFLPLMLTSCYSSIGILYGFIKLYRNFFQF